MLKANRSFLRSWGKWSGLERISMIATRSGPNSSKLRWSRSSWVSCFRKISKSSLTKKTWWATSQASGWDLNASIRRRSKCKRVLTRRQSNKWASSSLPSFWNKDQFSTHGQHQGTSCMKELNLQPSTTSTALSVIKSRRKAVVQSKLALNWDHTQFAHKSQWILKRLRYQRS
jgi:hypothetical protein